MNDPLVRLLWADDDSKGFLLPLERLLNTPSRFLLSKTDNYVGAMKVLEEAAQDNSHRIDSLLLDVILPHSEDQSALSTELGLKLADRAIAYGLKSVAFLTVVMLAEVLDRYRELVANHPDVTFAYYDKMRLLEPGEIKSLIDHLTRPNSTGNRGQK